MLGDLQGANALARSSIGLLAFLFGWVGLAKEFSNSHEHVFKPVVHLFLSYEVARAARSPPQWYVYAGDGKAVALVSPAQARAPVRQQNKSWHPIPLAVLYTVEERGA